MDKVDQDQVLKDARKQFAGAHILVAEDNEFNQMLIVELLSNWDIPYVLRKTALNAWICSKRPSAHSI